MAQVSSRSCHEWISIFLATDVSIVVHVYSLILSVLQGQQSVVAARRFSPRNEEPESPGSVVKQVPNSSRVNVQLLQRVHRATR